MHALQPAACSSHMRTPQAWQTPIPLQAQQCSQGCQCTSVHGLCDAHAAQAVVVRRSKGCVCRGPTSHAPGPVGAKVNGGVPQGACQATLLAHLSSRVAHLS